MKKVNCDLWGSTLTNDGVKLQVSNMVKFGLNVKFAPLVTYREYIDFINSELAAFRNEPPERETAEPVLTAKRHKNGSICFDFIDKENKITYRINPVKPSVWQRMFEQEYKKLA